MIGQQEKVEWKNTSNFYPGHLIVIQRPQFDVHHAPMLRRLECFEEI